MPEPDHRGDVPRDSGTHAATPLYLTADLPPVGGRIKDDPDDFFVDEQPLYQPCGEGEHIYMLVEKRNMSTIRVVRLLARHFDVPVRAVGYAGLKDKRAVTRQVFSVHVPGKKPEDFPMIRHDHMAVLWVDRHTNKLRPGHLSGNRFSIKIRGTDMTKAPVALKALERLEKIGVPNRIGEQRFGYIGRNHLIGRALLLGDHQGGLDALLGPAPGVQDSQAEARRLYATGDFKGAVAGFYKESRTERVVAGALSRGATPAQAVRGIEPMERGFFLTAFQSAAFNAVLDARLREGSAALAQFRLGDVAFKHDNRACFDVTAETLAQSDLAGRLERMEISPSGPMWGATMKRAAGTVDEEEQAALHALGVTLGHLVEYDRRHGGMIEGARRPLRVKVSYPDVEGGVDERGPYVRCAFDLPRGAFATSVLREIMKPEQAEGRPVIDPDAEPIEE